MIISVAAIILVLTGLSTLFSPIVSSLLTPDQEGECDACHDGFTPYEVVLDHPTEVPSGSSFEFKVHVINDRGHEVHNPYAVLDISSSDGLSFEGVEESQGSDEITGSVPRGGNTEVQFTFPKGTSSAVISLQGNSGILGRNDIDLTVTTSDGGSWQSNGNGVDEAVNLDRSDFADHGYDMYQISVDHSSGLLSIDYSILIEYTFGATEGSYPQEAETIGGGETHIFTWFLNSSEKGENEIVIEVTGTPYYDHSGGQIDSDTYTETITAEILVGDNYVYSSPDIGVSFARGMWFVGRILGFLTALSFLGSVLLGGLIKPLKPWLDQRLKNRVLWHCTLSYIAIFSSIVHLIILYTGWYRGTWAGLYLGGLTFLLMMLVALTGTSRRWIETTSLGAHWRRIHLILTVAVILSLVVHIVHNGSTLSFLGL